MSRNPSSKRSWLFATRLLQARKLREYTQAQLAEYAGFPPSLISHFESGKRQPSCENLIRLADALHISVDFLFGRESHPTVTGLDVADLLHTFALLSGEQQETLLTLASLLAAKRQLATAAAV